MKRLAHAVAAAAIALAAAGPAAGADAAPDPRCAVPDALLRSGHPLPRTTARLAAGQPLRIVAIGSSSTAGAGASRPERTYPARLEAALRARFPAAEISVVNMGTNGERARDMVARFPRDVIAAKADLAIWQLGTNAAMGKANPLAFANTMRDGLDMLRENGIDVLVMSQQYAPRFNQAPQHAQFVALVEEVTRERKVPLFRRYEIMQHWHHGGRFTFATMLSPDGLHLNDASYGCVAALVAAQIADQVPQRVAR
ncbi:MAG: SGNH/GDSL hydrolase family protein [Rhodospirillales bacterium]